MLVVYHHFQQFFSYIAAASAPIHAFLEFFEPVLCTIFFPSHRLFSHLKIVERMDSGERGMNFVAMTIINPRKEYWPSQGSNQVPPVPKSTMLPTRLWGSAIKKRRKCLSNTSFFFPKMSSNILIFLVLKDVGVKQLCICN